MNDEMRVRDIPAVLVSAWRVLRVYWAPFVVIACLGLALRSGALAEYHGVEHKAIAAYEQDAADAAVRAAILDTPLVKAALEAFPDAELEDWPGKRSNA